MVLLWVSWEAYQQLPQNKSHQKEWMKFAFLTHADVNSTAVCLQCEKMLFYNKSIFLTSKGGVKGSCGLSVICVPRTAWKIRSKILPSHAQPSFRKVCMFVQCTNEWSFIYSLIYKVWEAVTVTFLLLGCFPAKRSCQDQKKENTSSSKRQAPSLQQTTVMLFSPMATISFITSIYLTSVCDPRFIIYFTTPI